MLAVRRFAFGPFLVQITSCYEMTRMLNLFIGYSWTLCLIDFARYLELRTFRTYLTDQRLTTFVSRVVI